ncbi:hypothetical protein LR48_Vigan07g189600 [Vigna angularis]|uniref:Uncharacterized protein n=1 Tax=Phaseolus angularis TaxID=3914 RepID=A0A0L9V019_PHAAN|nr:hypothetical protein LR48_Vigan07g189600 [Vigna angularis]
MWLRLEHEWKMECTRVCVDNEHEAWDISLLVVPSKSWFYLRIDHGDSSNILEDSDAPNEVVIHVHFVRAWDGKPRTWPTVIGYDWAPYEVRQISSSFYSRCPFKDLAGHVFLVKAAKDASHFKLAICQMTERVCHGRENYVSDFFYAYATMFKDLKRGGDLKKTISEQTSSRAPLTAIAPKTTTPTQRTHPPPTVLDVPTANFARSFPSAAKKVMEAIHLSSDPTQKRKNRSKPVREPSTLSKHSKRALPDDPPLFGPLDTISWVAKRIHFDLFAKEKDLVKGMT